MGCPDTGAVPFPCAHNTPYRCSQLPWKPSFRKDAVKPLYFFFLKNTILSLLYFTCMDIQVLHCPLRCPGYFCGLVPGNPSRVCRCSAGESRPMWGPSAWAWPSSADWWDWLQETSPRPQTSSHTAYDTSWAKTTYKMCAHAVCCYYSNGIIGGGTYLGWAGKCCLRFGR